MASSDDKGYLLRLCPQRRYAKSSASDLTGQPISLSDKLCNAVDTSSDYVSRPFQSLASKLFHSSPTPSSSPSSSSISSPPLPTSNDSSSFSPVLPSTSLILPKNPSHQPVSYVLKNVLPLQNGESVSFPNGTAWINNNVMFFVDSSRGEIRRLVFVADQIEVPVPANIGYMDVKRFQFV